MKAASVPTLKKSYALFPVGVALNFVLVRSAPNLSQIPPVQIVRPLIAAGIAAAVFTLLIYLWLKDAPRAGAFSACCLYCFLYYGSIRTWMDRLPWTTPEWLRGLIILILGIAAALLVSSSAVWKKIKEPATVVNFLNVTLLVMMLVPAYHIGRNVLALSKSMGNIQEQQSAMPDTQFDTEAARPDIYYIILDGYGREDVLAELFGFDNTETISFLKDRGFYVAEAASSNYIQTLPSVNATLNLDYLNEWVAPLARTSSRWPMMQLIRNNRAQTIFESLGYTVVSISSVFQVDLADADFRFSLDGDSVLNEFERHLLAQTATRWIVEVFHINIPQPGFDAHRDTILYTLEQLSQVPETIPGPKFVFAHVLGPHPPFVLGRNGDPVSQNYEYTIGDGNGYPGTENDYRRGYTDELFYINTRVRQIVDNILAHSVTPPIIILQGDHGSAMYFDFNAPEKSCTKERTSILNAYYLPGVDTSRLYGTITPVNSFRLILDLYFGANLELLEDKSYSSTWEQPYVFTDVTGQAATPCTLP